MSLFTCNPLVPMSLFATNFGYPLPLYPGDVVFELPLNLFINSILDVRLSSEYTSEILF